MEDKEIIKTIAEETEPLFKQQFINGCLTGWNACVNTILKEIKDVHNCKEVKRIIKDKYKNRTKLNVTDEFITEEK